MRSPGQDSGGKTLDPGRQLLGGTMVVFLAESLLLPTGLLTAAFLTRRLGPADYGLLTLAATVVAWVEWGIASALARPTIKFVSEAPDWRPVGAVAAQLHLATSTGAALLLWFLAPAIATLLEERALAGYLRLFALDIPLFGLALAHRHILVGIGAFGPRALAAAGRWTARLLLIVLLVELGLSVPGAILGSIGASLVELIVGRLYVRPSLFRRARFLARQWWEYAIPIALFALSLRLYDRLDLLTLKALGATAAQVGIYGAAQNLSIAFSIFAVSFSPLLLSMVSRSLADGDRRLAKEIARQAMRAVIGLLPLTGAAAGAAAEIVGLIFGAAFSAAAPLLALLVFAALAMVMISVATAILTAAGKPGWTFALTGPLVPLALGGYLLSIPVLGAVGAALVTTVLAALAALTAVLAVYGAWRILPPAGTAWRSLLICGLAYGLALLWPAPGPLLVVKLAVIALAIPLAYLLLGEFSASEIALARSRLRGSLAPAHTTDRA
jgi:O-antigen/teichoic acid export membrane protein